MLPSTAIVVLAALAIAYLTLRVFERGRSDPALAAGSGAYRRAPVPPAGGAGIPAIVRVTAYVCIAQAFFTPLSFANFIRIVIRDEIIHWHPTVFSQGVTHAVFLLAGAFVLLRTGRALARGDQDAAAHARFAAGLVLLVRLMRIVGGLAGASHFVDGVVAWNEIPPAIPGLLSTLVVTGLLLRTVHVLTASPVAHPSSLSL